MLKHLFAFHHHVIYIRLHILAELSFKHPCHHSLIGGASIIQAKGHHSIMVVPSRGQERCLLLIWQR